MEGHSSHPGGKTLNANEKDLVRGNTDSILLRLIAESGRIHGYRLIKEISRRSKGYFEFREGTVYPALHKLEQAGLIRGEWAEQSGGLNRRYYTITEKGQAVLSRRLTAWREFTTAMDLVLGAGDA
jgi:DNA-binding PadR family transcriptional regulator